MKLSDLKYNRSRSVMVDVHGKEYPIKKHKGKNRFYIQHAAGQLTVTDVIVEKKWDLFMWYILDGLFQSYPCVVMDWWIRMRKEGKYISLRKNKK